MRTLVILVAIVSELLTLRAAFCCQCGWSGDDAAAIAEADRVFIGTRISSITVLQASPFSVDKIPVQRYVFGVEREIKGRPSALEVVTTTGGNCDFHFTDPGPYAVFLSAPDESGLRRATICRRTRPIASPTDPLLRVGTPKSISHPRWRYVLEPMYRPIWASSVFLALAIRHPFNNLSPYDPYRLRYMASKLCLAVAALLAVALSFSPLRARIGPRRGLAFAVLATILAVLTMYLYLRTSVWFGHHVL